MKTQDFNYHLPQELIAQTPIEKRDESKLLVIDKQFNNIEHRQFKDIIDYLNEDDLLVLNNSKVLPARLYGKKKPTNTRIEVLLLKNIDSNKWEVLLKPAKRVKRGTQIVFTDRLKCTMINEKEDGIRIVKFEADGNFYEIIDQIGLMPLPPYITEKLNNPDRYQTIYSDIIGSCAAPTAGLHFTKDLLEKIGKKGIRIAYITLHVGISTFRPVKVDDVRNHIMHEEYYEISEQTAKLINDTKKIGKKIIAVGTTSVRTLEANAIKNNGTSKKDFDNTNLFIYPGFEFKVVDSIITNFHLPKSTLLMLISAFYTKEEILNAYNIAVKEKYRFFSFGDAMLIK